MRICICGGGSLGHVCAGVLSSRAGVELSLLTSRPEQWSSQITVRDPDGRSFRAAIKHISANPEDVIVGQDIILLCLPGFMLEKTLQQIRPFVGKAIVGSIVSSTGFFFFAHQILGKDARVFGFQRVPFIARVEEYGKSARLLGYKKELFMAAENIPQSEEFCQKIEQLFRTPIIFRRTSMRSLCPIQIPSSTRDDFILFSPVGKIRCLMPRYSFINHGQTTLPVLFLQWMKSYSACSMFWTCTASNAWQIIMRAPTHLL